MAKNVNDVVTVSSAGMESTQTSLVGMKDWSLHYDLKRLFLAVSTCWGPIRLNRVCFTISWELMWRWREGHIVVAALWDACNPVAQFVTTERKDCSRISQRTHFLKPCCELRCLLLLSYWSPSSYPGCEILQTYCLLQRGLFFSVINWFWKMKLKYRLVSRKKRSSLGACVASGWPINAPSLVQYAVEVPLW